MRVHIEVFPATLKMRSGNIICGAGIDEAVKVAEAMERQNGDTPIEIRTMAGGVVSGPELRRLIDEQKASR